MRNIYQLLALVTIWASSTVGAIATGTPQVYIVTGLVSAALFILIGATS